MADKFLTEERKKKLDAAFDALDFFNPNIKTTLDKIDDYNKKVEKLKQTETDIEELPKGSPGFKKASIDKTLIESAEDNNEVSLSTSVSNAVLSGLIKIPYGWAQLTAEIKDAIGDDVPIDKTNVAKLDAWFDQTVVGEMMKYSEEKARATGAGRITEFLTSMYGNWRAAGKPLMKFIDDPLILKKKGKEIADKLVDAKKNGRYISSNNRNLKKRSR